MNPEQPDQPVRIPDDVKTRHTANARDAREQATEWLSPLRSEFRGPNNEYEIPHKDLFDNEQNRRWEDLLFERQNYDRDPDITASDGTVIRRGDVLIPYRKDGERIRSDIDPSRYATVDEQYAVVLWGVEGARAADEAGVLFSEIAVVWARQAEELARWRARDSKSVDRDSGVEAAPDGD